MVILDRNMPGMGGMEALQALRLMMRGRERLPVIMLSADVTPEAKREALEAGADAFLSKPIEALRLLDEIQALAGGKAGAAPRSAGRVEARRRPAPQRRRRWRRRWSTSRRSATSRSSARRSLSSRS